MAKGTFLMKLVLGVLIMVALFGGCRQVEFVGEEYPITAHVDLYCSWGDVQEDHRVIGHLVPIDEDMNDVRKMRKNMIRAARLNGADAIVIVGAGPCSEGLDSEYSPGASALRAHQVKVSLIRYRADAD